MKVLLIKKYPGKRWAVGDILEVGPQSVLIREKYAVKGFDSLEEYNRFKQQSKKSKN